MTRGRDPTPPNSGRDAGTTTDAAARPCPNCCCCAVSAAIQNVRPIGTTPLHVQYGTYDMSFTNGHAFDFVMSFSYRAGTAGTTDCTFEWWERVNLPAHATHPANTWTEMYTVGSPTSPIWIPWTERVIPCPGGGNLTVTFVDPPSLGSAPGRTLTRTLEFRLVTKSGAGCGCGKSSVTATATQVLVMVNGVLDSGASSFTIGASSETH